MNERAFKVPLDDGGSVSASLLVPKEGDQHGSALLVLAHGAGNDGRNPFLSFVFDGMARAGIATLKFNQPARAHGIGAKRGVAGDRRHGGELDHRPATAG